MAINRYGFTYGVDDRTPGGKPATVFLYIDNSGPDLLDGVALHLVGDKLGTVVKGELLSITEQVWRADLPADYQLPEADGACFARVFMGKATLSGPLTDGYSLQIPTFNAAKVEADITDLITNEVTGLGLVKLVTPTGTPLKDLKVMNLRKSRVRTKGSN